MTKRKGFMVGGMAVITWVFLFFLPPAHGGTNLTMAAIDTTSDTYMIAVGWSNALKKAKSDVNITPIEGGGTVKLLRGVASDKWDIGFIASPHYLYAVNGKLQFKNDPADLREKYKKVRALFGVTSGMGQYAVRADSGVKDIFGLKGKKVSIGTPGGMAGTVTQALFRAHGIDAAKGDFSPQYLKYTQALDEMRNNRLDAALVWGGIPQAALYNFSRQFPIHLLPIDKSAFSRFKKEIPQGELYLLKEFAAEKLKRAYGDGVRQDTPAHFWTFQMMVVVRENMPQEVAFKIVQNFWENLDTVKATGAALADIGREEALEALSAQLHPGALKYYRGKGWMK